MNNTASPFEDPEFIEMLRQAGVGHKPGMAAGLMEEIAPLLAAEGFDLNNLDDDVDWDNLNAAMGRAIERHNMELMTPVGDARAVTLNTLREFTLAYHGGSTSDIDLIMAELEPEPAQTRPSFGHLTGVALEILDTWFTDDALLPALTRVPIEHASGGIRSFIPTLEALARKGRAYRSLDSLLMKHPGDVVAEAGTYLVAACVVTVAAHRRQPVETVLDSMLPGQPVSPDYAPQPSFDSTTEDELADHLYDFEEWLDDEAAIGGTNPDSISTFEMIVDAALRAGIDPFDPERFAALVEVVHDWEQPEIVLEGLTVLHDYVHFRMGHDDDVEPWETPHILISEAADNVLELPPEIEAAMQELADIPEEERFEAVTSTPLITGVDKLMQWMGASKPVTTTGVPKRSDIATVAAMIGIDAKGVAKLPPLGDITAEIDYYYDLTQPARPQPPQHVQSAGAISELLAWWTTMQTHWVIEVTSTRVRPGSDVQHLLHPELENLASVEMFVMGYIREYFVAEVESRPLGYVGVTQTLQRILVSLTTVDPTPDTGGPWQDVGFDIVSTQHLRSLEALGLIQLHRGDVWVPQALRPMMLVAVMMVLDLLEPLMWAEDD